MAGSDTVSDDYIIIGELALGLTQPLPAGAIVGLGEFYSYGPTIQVCLMGEDQSSEFWFTIRKSLNAANKTFVMMSYPPAYYDAEEQIPLVLAELLPNKTIRTVSEQELKELEPNARKIANSDERLDIVALNAVLGHIPEWDEIKHRM